MRQQVAIRGGTIRLGQLLKLAGVVDAGGAVKALLADGLVQVNDELEQRRGRQLVPGDRVRIADLEIEIVAADSA